MRKIKHFKVHYDGLVYLMMMMDKSSTLRTTTAKNRDRMDGRCLPSCAAVDLYNKIFEIQLKIRFDDEKKKK
jgi:hypothetical protein